MASPDQVAVVATLHKTFSDGDLEGFVAQLAEDAVIRPTTLIAGSAEYRGVVDVRAGFGELAQMLESRGEDVTVEPLRFYVDRADDSVVASVARVTITSRDDETYATELLYLWRMDGEKVAELATWIDVDEGLEQLRDPEEVKA